MVDVALPAEPGRGWRLFANSSVKAKILTAVGVAVLVAVIVGIVGLRALQKANNAAQLMFTSSVASINAVSSVRPPMLQARLDLANHALSADTATKAKYEQKFRPIWMPSMPRWSSTGTQIPPGSPR